MLVAGPVSGWLGNRFGSRTPLLIGIGGGARRFVQLAILHDAHWHLYLSSRLMGAGIGLAFAAMATLIVDAVPQTQTGVATGMNTIMRSIGGALGAQIVASIVAARPTRRTSSTAFLVSAGGLASRSSPRCASRAAAARPRMPHGARRLGEPVSSRV